MRDNLIIFQSDCVASIVAVSLKLESSFIVVYFTEWNLRIPNFASASVISVKSSENDFPKFSKVH